jgi:cytochrome c
MNSLSWKWLLIGAVVIVVVVGGLVYAFGRGPDGPQIIGAPQQAKTAWDQEHWAEVMRGYELATNTYEQLPENAPVDRLHCSSCHIHAGGNPQSAWWVGLRDRYPTNADLQARINQCLESSMNGVALCTPAAEGNTGDCEANPEMAALLTYMTWLDQQWAAQGLETPAPQGYPQIAQLTGDVARGDALFEPKCGICHGVAGQGQTAQGEYAFPPLQSVHTFNASVDLDRNQEALAQFIKWNMPYNVPGTLSDQQAWDLAAYLESQPRPSEVITQ